MSINVTGSELLQAGQMSSLQWQHMQEVRGYDDHSLTVFCIHKVPDTRTSPFKPQPYPGKDFSLSASYP